MYLVLYFAPTLYQLHQENFTPVQCTIYAKGYCVYVQYRKNKANNEEDSYFQLDICSAYLVVR